MPVIFDEDGNELASTEQLIADRANDDSPIEAERPVPDPA